MLKDHQVFTDTADMVSHYREVRRNLSKGYARRSEVRVEPEPIPVTEPPKKTLLPSVRVSAELLEQYQRSMDGLIHSGKAKKVTMADVLAEVAKKHGLEPLRLKARVRRKELTEARFEAFYRMRNELKMSYPQIGMFFGMDHTSILHGVRMHEQKLEKAKNNG
jgi:hypothetical protein